MLGCLGWSSRVVEKWQLLCQWMWCPWSSQCHHPEICWQQGSPGAKDLLGVPLGFGSSLDLGRLCWQHKENSWMWTQDSNDSYTCPKLLGKYLFYKLMVYWWRDNNCASFFFTLCHMVPTAKSWLWPHVHKFDCKFHIQTSSYLYLSKYLHNSSSCVLNIPNPLCSS